MPIESSLITFGAVVLTWAGSFIAFKTSVRKDIDNLCEKTREHDKKIDGFVNKKDCEERRDEFSKGLTEIKDTVVRLENKFDKYLLNGRN